MTTGVVNIVFSGLSTNENTLETLAAGSSTAFRIVITGFSANADVGVLDVLRTVPASTSLFVTISATDGQTTTISDPRNVRVTAR